MKEVCANGNVEYRNSNGKLHRTDGPAIEHANVNDYKTWYINGERLADMIDGEIIILTEGELPLSIKQSIAMEKLKA